MSINKLSSLLDFLSYSNVYYSDLLRKYKSFEDIPFLEREHLYKFGLSGDRSLISKGLKIGYIFSTGGTTGKQKYIAYSFEEFDVVCDYLSLCFSGLEVDDVVANLFMSGNMWASFLAVSKSLEKIKPTVLPISGITDFDLAFSYISFFKPNVLLGLPSYIVQILKKLKDSLKDLDDLFVKKIYYAGEMFEDISFAKSMNIDFIRSAGYASVDADVIGFQCHNLSLNYHHIFVDHQLVEIVDTSNNKVIRDYNITGEIVVTNLDRYLNPVVRYKTGDLGRWVKANCSCNLPTIELLGRFDDWIRLATYDFYYSDFVKAFYPFKLSLKINRKENIVSVLLKEEEGLKVDQEYFIEKLKEVNWQLKEAIEKQVIKINVSLVKSLPKTNKKINVIYE